jgi:hypothetical protein
MDRIDRIESKSGLDRIYRMNRIFRSGRQVRRTENEQRLGLASNGMGISLA